MYILCNDLKLLTQLIFKWLKISLIIYFHSVEQEKERLREIPSISKAPALPASQPITVAAAKIASSAEDTSVKPNDEVKPAEAVISKPQDINAQLTALFDSTNLIGGLLGLRGAGPKLPSFRVSRCFIII